MMPCDGMIWFWGSNTINLQYSNGDYNQAWPFFFNKGTAAQQVSYIYIYKVIIKYSSYPITSRFTVVSLVFIRSVDIDNNIIFHIKAVLFLNNACIKICMTRLFTSIIYIYVFIFVDMDEDDGNYSTSLLISIYIYIYMCVCVDTDTDVTKILTDTASTNTNTIDNNKNAVLRWRKRIWSYYGCNTGVLVYACIYNLRKAAC